MGDHDDEEVVACMRPVSDLASRCVLWSSKEDALLVVEQFKKAFDASDVEGVVKLFAPDAVFLGTVSPVLVTKTDQIDKYFQGLRQFMPRSIRSAFRRGEVAFGSKAPFWKSASHFRSSPISRPFQCPSACLTGAQERKWNITQPPCRRWPTTDIRTLK